MPIPVLKMKPQKRPDEARTSAPGAAKGAASPRGIPRGAPGHTNPVSSHIPSPLAPRDTKSRIATIATKNQRATPSVGAVRQSPKPPPRTSSAVSEPRLRAPIKTPPVHREPMYTKNKTVGPKRFEFTPFIPKNTGQTSSNRSSVVSNCSSIPPPSSSSSNRNSNSSISSNFSIGSWNSGPGQSAGEEDSPFSCGGADTFPRASYNSRLRQPEENLTKSMEEPTKAKPSARRTLPRPTSRQQPALASSKAKMPCKQLSSSETAIPNKNRIVLPMSNYSDTNLTTLRGIKPRFGSDKSLTRPIAAVKGKSKHVSSSRSSTPEEDSQKTLYKDNIAMVAPYCSSESRVKKATRTTKDSNEEDDGYSSVANTDQTEETFAQRRTSSEDDDYDEVAEIEPMKPINFAKSYLSRDKTQSSHPNQEKQADHSQTNSSMPPPSLKQTQRPAEPPNPSRTRQINPKMMYSRQPQNKTREPEGVSVHPHQKPGMKPPDRRPSQPSICVQNFPKAEAKSALDDSVLKLSYKDFVKRETTEKAGYNWMSRNTIDMKLSKEPHRRKLTYPEQPETPCANTGVSYDKRMPSSAPARRSLELPQRPNSLNTDQILNTRGIDSFQRSGSLRSPSLDSTPETKILCFTGSPGPVPTRKYGGPASSPSFNRGAYKYSTVIPRTSNEQRERRDSAYSSGSPSDCKMMEESLLPQENVDQTELEKLKGELKSSKESIRSLKEQLAASNKLVSAYEHSLTNMTHRLHQLSKVTEKKDCEISELRRLLERSCTESSVGNFKSNTIGGHSINRGPSMESLTSLMSTDSVSSSISTTSTMSNMSSADPETREKHKKKSWLRSSFSKAFKRKSKRPRGDDSATDTETESQAPFYRRSVSECHTMKGYCSLPSSPLPQRLNGSSTNLDKTNTVYHSQQQIASVLDEVTRLRITLQEKDSALTESRLESLSSAHQIEALRESIHKLTMEVTCLRSKDRNNAITQALTSPKAASSSSKSLKVVLNGNLHIGSLEITSKTSWKEFDSQLSKAILQFCYRVDPDLSLSITQDSILQYRVGEISKHPGRDIPEFLPYGYLVGEVDSVVATLKSMESWSLESCIPMGSLQDYFSHLKEHRRIVLAGPKGTCKRYIASRIASLIIERLGVQPSTGNIAKFQVTSDNQHDLSSYLNHVSDLCVEKSPDLPLVIILEQLDRVDSVQEVLASSLRVPHDQCPYIIGTIQLSKSKKDMVSLSNNFKWIYLDPELEPMNELLPRMCRRQRILRQKKDENEIVPFLDWLPRFYKKFNAVLNGTSVEVLGPSLLVPVPESFNEAKSWFNQIWNTSLLPLIQKAAQETSFIPQDAQVWDNLGKSLGDELPWKSSTDLPDLPRPF